MLDMGSHLYSTLWSTEWCQDTFLDDFPNQSIRKQDKNFCYYLHFLDDIQISLTPLQFPPCNWKHPRSLYEAAFPDDASNLSPVLHRGPPCHLVHILLWCFFQSPKQLAFWPITFRDPASLPLPTSHPLGLRRAQRNTTEVRVKICVLHIWAGSFPCHSELWSWASLMSEVALLCESSL